MDDRSASGLRGSVSRELTNEDIEHLKNEIIEIEAAINTPNLTPDDRKNLILDAYERARDSGHYFDYTKKAREIIYGSS